MEENQKEQIIEFVKNAPDMDRLLLAGFIAGLKMRHAQAPAEYAGETVPAPRTV